MKKYYFLIRLCMFFMIFHASSFAEPILLEEIIVRGKKEVPQEECLDIKEVRETPARDVGDALKVIEGITAIRKGAIANDIVLRSFQRDNINCLIDGMRIYGACPNRMDPNSFHIDFMEIDTISVLKGPFDVKNPGSMGGVVEIKTIRPDKGWGSNINIFAGSDENISASFNVSRAGERLDLLLGYSHRYSLPYRDGNGDRITEFDSSDSNTYKKREKDDNAYSINTYWSKFGINLLDNHRLELDYARQEADDVIYPYLLMDAVYDDTDRLNMNYEISSPGHHIKKLKAQFYWNQVKHDMTDEKRLSSMGFDEYKMRCYAEAATFGGKFESDIFLPNGILTLGVDYYFRNWEAENTLPMGKQKMMPDVDSSNIGTYMEYGQPMGEDIRLTLGLRFDCAKTKANDDRTDLYALYHNTRDREETDSYAGGNIQFLYTPVKEIELFGGFGAMTRPPAPDERYIAMKKPQMIPDWVGNPKLNPSENREFDFGVKYLGDILYGKTTFFYSDIKNFISVYDLEGPVKSARSFRNVDATLYGGEINLNLFLPFDFHLQGGLSYTRARDDTNDKPLSEIPPLQGRIASRYDVHRYFAEIEGIFADGQHRVDPDLNEDKTPGWGIMNLKFGLKFKKMNIFAGVNNLFDRYYCEHLSYQRDPFRNGIKVPETGRNFYLNLAWSL